MRKTKEIMRLKYEGGLSYRQIALACSVSPATVSDCLGRVGAAGLTWPLPADVDEVQLEARLYHTPGEPAPADTAEPDWAYVHRELRRKHVTRMLLWQEYKAAHPEGYQYSWFCERYEHWRGHLDVVMRQSHTLGERVFVDWAGDTTPVVDAASGEISPAYLFLGVLGASNYTYAEVSFSLALPAFLGAHVRMFSWYGGVPELIVCDNTKTGVTKPCYFEPDINPAYLDLARHYGCAVLPARVRKPRDKAKVEVGVLVAERWILAAIRNRTFFSLGELSLAVREQLVLLNERSFQKMPGSRRQLFTSEEEPTLRALPLFPYVFGRRRRARVHPDGHVELAGHYYSVPYGLVREEVELLYTDSTLEVFYRGVRVAAHALSSAKGRATTCPEHLPPGQRAYAEWTPERFISWAEKTGPATAEVVRAILAGRSHPALGFRSCMGVLHLGDRFGGERLEAAARRALHLRSYSYRSLVNTLEHHLEEQPLPGATCAPAPLFHENLRGPDYFKS